MNIIKGKIEISDLETNISALNIRIHETYDCTDKLIDLFKIRYLEFFNIRKHDIENIQFEN